MDSLKIPSYFYSKILGGDGELNMEELGIQFVKKKVAFLKFFRESCDKSLRNVENFSQRKFVYMIHL